MASQGENKDNFIAPIDFLDTVRVVHYVDTYLLLAHVNKAKPKDRLNIAQLLIAIISGQ